MARKKERGRPKELVMPEPIDASPERIAEVVLQAKPKKVWRYLEGAKARREPQSPPDNA